jgi:Beta-propeller repeat
VRTQRLLQLSLPVLAFLVACGETPNLRSTEVTGDSSTINGSIAASKAVDVDLESTLPVMRIQSTPGSNRLRAKATTSTDAFNALLSLKGTFVVAVNANGQVLGSSPIADDGSFSVSTQKNQTVALLFANKGASGAWVCQQPLEYNDGTTVQTAVLNSGSSRVQAGRFSFKASTGRASSSVNQASVTPINDARFSSNSLDGYQGCGNPNVEEIVVRGDYNITWPSGLNANDSVRGFTRSMVFGLDTTVTGKPRFVGAGTVNADGKLEMRVRHEAGSSLKLSPTIADERSFEALNGPGLLMPTWNMGIPASDVSQRADFGTIKAEIVQATGDVVSSNDTPQVGASIDASLAPGTSGTIAQSQTMTGEAGKLGEGAAFNLLVPKPQDPNAAFVVKIVSMDKLETAQALLQPSTLSFVEPKRLKTQPLNSVRTHQFGSLENDSIRAMALDAQQNLFVLGETTGLINGAGSTSFGGKDLFVSKFTPNGSLTWQKQIGSSYTDEARALLVRADGSVLIGTYNLSRSEVGLIKLSATGDIVWEGQILLTNESNLNISSLVQDASNNVYLAGSSVGTQRTSGTDALVAMYSSVNIDQNTSMPNPTWKKTFTSNGSKSDEIRGVTFDSSQNLIMAGTTAGAFNAMTSAGKQDLFVARFPAAELGHAIVPASLEINQTGTTNDDEASAIAADSSGNVYVTGFTNGGTGTGPAHDSGFLQRFDSSLAATWTSTLATNDSSNAENLAVSVDQGSIYVTGKTSGPIGTTVLAGASDMTVARFEADGSRTWLKQFGTVASDAGLSIVVRNGRVIVGGYSNDSLNGQIPIGKQDAVLIDFSVLGI